MACGNCSCGHNHDHGSAKNKSGMKTWSAVLGGMLLGGAVLVGAAMALQPDDKKAPPTPPPATTPATPAKPADAKAPAAPAKPADAKPTTPADTKPGRFETVEAETISPYVLGFTMKKIDGTDQKLDEYKGKVVLIVNVASQCGNTKQYTGLEKLYESKKDAGLVILGFPANNFGSQEPGTNKEIAEFCTSKFQVTFPMFEKISVKGEDAHPLYKQLAAQPKPVGGEPDWNFAKYVVDRQGNVVSHFKAGVKPDNEELVKKIDELLNAKK